MVPTGTIRERQLLPLKESDMARRNISGRKHGKKFARARRKTKAVNSPQHIMRGGFRL